MSTSKLQVREPMKIVLADDGSQHALAAAAMICDLPLPRGSKVSVVGVLPARMAESYAVMEAGLEQTKSLLKRKGIRAETVLLGGHPAQKLIEYADEHRPDLIVLGARGLRATLGILLGGVAQQVVEYAYWPVLVVRAPYTGLSRILLVVDGSVHNRRAVEYLARFPVPDGCDFRVMHILPPLLEAPSLEAPSLEGALLEDEQVRSFRGVSRVSTSKAYEKPVWQVEEECEGRAILDEALNTLQAAGLQATGVLQRGDVATKIIEYSKTNGIDLVVGASRGMTLAASWSLGSVSRKLIHYGAASVLLVR